RAFARDLGMSQTLLSMILSGKRPLTLKQAVKIGLLLNLSSEEAEKLMHLALASVAKDDRKREQLAARFGLRMKKALDGIDDRYFFNYETEVLRALNGWHHLAILDLATTSGFKSDPIWIARRLGLNPIEVRDSIDRLLRLGLLKKVKDRLQKAHAKI